MSAGSPSDPPPGSIRILIADDEPRFRRALTDLVSLDPALVLVAATEDASSAIAAAQEHLPDVAILDYRMPGGGPRAAREIRVGSPSTRILVLSAYDDEGAKTEMSNAGADGYLVKGSSVEDVLAAIHQAAEAGRASGPRGPVPRYR